MTSLKRPDSDHLKRLDDMRRTFDRLRAERIRAEGEVERLSHERDEARELARAELGTDDEAEIRRMIEAGQAENARLIDEFAAALREVEARLQQLGDDR